jgi:hypothetical protein
MHYEFLYQVEVWSVSGPGRFCTDMKVSGYQWIVFALYTRNWFLLSLSVFLAVSGLTLAWSMTPYVIVLHICSVLNKHIWSPVMSVCIMVDCADFCTQLTTLKSPHNKRPGRFCCRLVLNRIRVLLVICVALWAYWSRMGKHKLLIATGEIYMWYFDVRTDESILWTSVFYKG